jgi:hypothetical protein
MRNKILFIICLMFLVLFPWLLLAQENNIQQGIAWLEQNQNPEGSWGETEITVYQDTFSVVETFSQLGNTNLSYTNAIKWISSQEFTNTSYLALQILTLHQANIDVSQLLEKLLSYRNGIEGWGADSV